MLLDSLNKGVAQVELNSGAEAKGKDGETKEELVGADSHSGAMEQIAV